MGYGYLMRGSTDSGKRTPLPPLLLLLLLFLACSSRYSMVWYYKYVGIKWVDARGCWVDGGDGV